MPYRDRSSSRSSTVTVMPRGIDRSIAARSGVAQEDHLLEVAVQKRLEGTDESALAPLVAALEAVAEHLSGLDVASGRRCIEVRIDPLLAEDHAVNLRVFTGVVQARFGTRRILTVQGEGTTTWPTSSEWTPSSSTAPAGNHRGDGAHERAQRHAQPREGRGGRHHPRQRRMEGDRRDPEGRERRVRDGLGHRRTPGSPPSRTATSTTPRSRS
jgi:hypothetical protein